MKYFNYQTALLNVIGCLPLVIFSHSELESGPRLKKKKKMTTNVQLIYEGGTVALAFLVCKMGMMR